MPSITVVLATFTERRWPHLKLAVRSLHAQKRRPDQIVVVVDHNPTLLPMVDSELPGVVVVPNSGPVGLAAARNAGIRAAHGEIVAFLDDDAQAEPDWLARLHGAYADASVVGVGGSVAPAWETRSPPWFPPEFLWVVGCSHRGLPERPARVRNLIGCNMSFRARALLDAGGFRHGIGRVGALGQGCEETELCIRLTELDGSRRIVYYPAARVRHHVPTDRARWSYFQRRCWAEGVSKAIVAASVGRRRALATERTYTTRVLPRAIAREFRRALTGDGFGLLGATAIGAGLAVTTCGYVTGRVRAPRAATNLATGGDTS
jgi:O-antigen biosynthesis protein